MPSPPAVVLLDDGELDRFAAVLRRLGVEFLHLRGRQIGRVVEKPTDLLVSSLNRTVKRPEFESYGSAEAPQPIQICVHQQDVLTLRERLCKLGIHFLIDSRIDPETLCLLLPQLLHRGAERRGARRVPFGCPLDFWSDGAHHTALLAELSLDGCRMLTNDAVREGTPLRIQLPRSLAPFGKIEICGSTVRCTPCEPSQDVTGFNVAVEFSHEGRDTQAALDEILSGRQPGTHVTPLSPMPEPGKPAATQLAAKGDLSEDLPEVTFDGRQDERRRYDRRVAALGTLNADAPQVVLGRDLSVSGMRAAKHPSLSVGSELALGIYGREGSTPLVVEAEVVNDAGEAGIGLRFFRVTPDIRRRLEEIMDDLPELESLEEEATLPDRIFVSKVLPSEG